MKIEIWALQKTAESYLLKGENEYLKRLKHYIKTEIRYIEGPKLSKKHSVDQVRDIESAFLLQLLEKEQALVVALDETGQQLSSVEFSGFIEKSMAISTRKMIFLIGGAFGFSNDLLSRADKVLSLGKMTFTHQMIRLFLAEQIYRAMTIIRNESYHH